MANVTVDMCLSQPYPMAGGSTLGTTDSLYALARKRARRGQFWSSLTRPSPGLLALKQGTALCAIQAESDGGIRTVPSHQIRDREGRSRYIDRDLNPLYDRAPGARQQGKSLPPVVLVQVGDLYFVQDGHHHISVAQALGQSRGQGDPLAVGQS